MSPWAATRRRARAVSWRSLAKPSIDEARHVGLSACASSNTRLGKRDQFSGRQRPQVHCCTRGEPRTQSEVTQSSERNLDIYVSAFGGLGLCGTSAYLGNINRPV